MVTVTLALDDGTWQRWQRLAQEHLRSPEDEIRAVLTEIAPLDWAEAKAAAETIRAQVPASDVPSDILIRQMRDER